MRLHNVILTNDKPFPIKRYRKIDFQESIADLRWTDSQSA